MRLGRRIIMFCFVAVLMACSDILEEPDITNSIVPVFAPLNNTIVTTNDVSLNWDGIADARAYRVQLAQPDFNNTQQILMDSTVTLDSLGNVRTEVRKILLNGNYSWRVKALNGGFETAYATNNFEVDADADLDVIPPNTPTLVAPANETSQDEAIVNFSWMRADVSGTAERDSIYFFSDEALTMRIGSDIGANKAYTASFEPGTYFWSVQAFDAGGNTGETSGAFTFTIN